MKLPDDIVKIIREYSKPMTRPDWRKGCYYNKKYKCYGINYSFKYIVILMYRLYRYHILNIHDNMIYSELLMNTVHVF